MRCLNKLFEVLKGKDWRAMWLFFICLITLSLLRACCPVR